MPLIHTRGSLKLGPVERVWRRIAVHDTVGAAETSFTWDGLNGDSDEEYKVIARWLAPNPAGDDVLTIQPNADADVTHYNSQHISAANAVLAAGHNFGVGVSGFILGECLNNSDLVMAETVIRAKTGLNRTSLAYFGNAENSTLMELFMCVWLESVTPISSLKVTTLFAAADIGVGSHFELWTPRY